MYLGNAHCNQCQFESLIIHMKPVWLDYCCPNCGERIYGLDMLEVPNSHDLNRSKELLNIPQKQKRKPSEILSDNR